MSDMVSYPGKVALFNRHTGGGWGEGNFCANENVNENWYSDNMEASVHLFKGNFMLQSGLEKSSVLSVLDRFLKLKTDLFFDKKLKNRSIKLCLSQDFAIHTDIVTCQNCSHLIIRCYLS